MPETPSRRELLKAGALGAAAMVVPAALAQTPTTDSIEKDLGHSLPDEAKKLLPDALKANANNASERLKTKLPDCSEPCFVYVPTGVKRK